MNGNGDDYFDGDDVFDVIKVHEGIADDHLLEPSIKSGRNRSDYFREYRGRPENEVDAGEIAEKDRHSRDKRAAYMREYRLNKKQQKPFDGDDEALLAKREETRVNKTLYMRQYRAKRQPASDLLRASDESKREKNKLYMREYRAKRQLAHDSSPTSDDDECNAEPAASRRANRTAYQREYRAQHPEAFRAYERRRYARFKSIRQQWDIDHPCAHCGKVWLQSSRLSIRKKCCLNGVLWNDLLCPLVLQPLPLELERGFYSNEFVAASNQYNNLLSLGAVGVENDKPVAGWDIIRGHSAVRLSGRSYHFIPASNTRGGLQYFLHDGRSQELANHGRERNVDIPILERIFQFLQQNNVLCKSYATIGAMADFEIRRQNGENVADAISPNQLNDLLPRLSHATVEFDVSSISIDRISGNHILRVSLKSAPHTQSTIPCESELFEPIAYPILFPYGETGWGNSFRTGRSENGSPCIKISFMDYLASRMLMPERYRNDYCENMEPSDEELANPHFGKFGRWCTQIETNRRFFYPSNRFERFSRLGQTYLVDQMSRAIDYRLAHVRTNQEHIFGASRRDAQINDDSNDEEEDLHGSNPTMADIVAEGALPSLTNSRHYQPEEVYAHASRPSFLGDDFCGSKRHLKKQAINGLHIVSHFGPSHIFATLTCNKNWPEFKEVLWPESDVFDMPALVAEVFHARLEAFLHNLRHGKYFGGDTTVFIIRVIEYQERGLPHAHIVYRLEAASRKIQENLRRLQDAYELLPEAEKLIVPQPSYDDAAALWVDEHISAELPIDPRLPEHRDKYGDLYDRSVEFQEDLKLFLNISKFHIHTHSGPDLVNGCLDKNGVCKKGFMKNVVRPATSFSKDGFPQYRRNSVHDLNVVPYNRLCSLDWDGHINIEFSGLTYTVLYLYKYLYKGPSKIQLTLLAPPPRPGILPLHPKDEIGRYIRGRRLCSMDAMWRLFGFQNYPSSEPSVIGVKVRSPQFVTNYEDKQLLLHITAYFARPAELGDRLFADLFKDYRVVRVRPSDNWIQTNGAHNFFHLTSLSGRFGREVFLIRRDPKYPVLCRLHTVAYSSGDLWYERLLLKLFPFWNFKHMRTFEGVEHDTFQEAAIARGIANDAKECEECFTLAAIDEYRTPRELRFLFVTMAVNAMPVMIIYNNDLLRSKMLEPAWIADPHNGPDNRIANESLLTDLSRRFAENGKTNSDYGVPEPASTETELERYHNRFGNVQEQLQLYQNLTHSRPLNLQQKRVFDSITADIAAQSKDAPGTFLTLEGSGGCGKTELAKQLIAYIRSTPQHDSPKAKSVHVVCSTALGAQNYAQGECSTAHSFFCLPVEEEFDKEVDNEEGITCNVATKPDRLALIKAADVIIWDEAMANHRECLEAVLKAFDNFKGKVLLLMFDAKQMLPVIPGGDHLEVVKSCIFSSPHWNSFKRHLLTENMRLLRIEDPTEQALQVQYDKMIRAIGENQPLDDLVIEDEILEGQQTSATHKRFTLTGIPSENIFNAQGDESAFQKAVQWLYPNGYNADHAAKNVVLATTNVIVDEWNDRIAALNPNQEHSPLLSQDSFTDVDDPNGHLKRMISDEVLNKYNTNDVPPHKLLLKVDDVCLIMRNLNVNDGITNNTRVRILRINTKYITCQTIGENPVSVLLPRIRFNFRLPYGRSFMMTRLQFPLRRAFALSVHKSQGQTLERGLIDARGGFFAHGHLYVGMSRVTRYDKISLFVNWSQLYTDLSPSACKIPFLHLKPLLQNIVYPEAINEIQALTDAHNAEQAAAAANGDVAVESLA